MAPTARRRVTLSTGSRLGPGPSVLTSRGDLPDFRGPRHVPTLPPAWHRLCRLPRAQTAR